jgi:predicted nucleotidyltransferase
MLYFYKAFILMTNLLTTAPHVYKLRPEARDFAEAVKKRVALYDPEAKAILFGSRARGDAEPDSDWDLLVLTKKTDTESLNRALLTDLLHQVEMPNDWIISLIVRNEDDWMNRYSVSPFFDTIQLEGIEH